MSIGLQMFFVFLSVDQTVSDNPRLNIAMKALSVHAVDCWRECAPITTFRWEGHFEVEKNKNKPIRILTSRHYLSLI